MTELKKTAAIWYTIITRTRDMFLELVSHLPKGMWLEDHPLYRLRAMELLREVHDAHIRAEALLPEEERSLPEPRKSFVMMHI
jgi:hypothetical protein